MKEQKKIVSTKNNRKTPRVKCVVSGITKTRFLPRTLSEPSCKEGAGILSSVTDTVTELFISKGIPYLAKSVVEAGRHYASKTIRNPALQKKAMKYGIKKARPAIERFGTSCLSLSFVYPRRTKEFKRTRSEMSVHSRIELELENVAIGFLGEGKIGVSRRKTSRSREENQQQTQPTYDTLGPFLERPDNLTGPKSYFEIKLSRKIGSVLTSNEVQFVYLADNFAVQFSSLLKLSSGMENKTAQRAW